MIILLANESLFIIWTSATLSEIVHAESCRARYQDLPFRVGFTYLDNQIKRMREAK